MQIPIFGGTFFAILGLLWGSFFNVVIWRLPEESDLVFKPSHCLSCKKKLRWFHNIPVFSWLFLRGKCAHCNARISIQYPLVEIATSLIFLGTYLAYGWSFLCFFYILFFSVLLIISVIDIRLQIIPDELSLGGIVVGFLFSFHSSTVTWIDSGLGILIGGGAFLLIAYVYEKISKREGLGGGDIKLLGMIGAWLGIEAILPVIVISSALGSVIGIFMMVFAKGDMKTAIPFGPFLALAAVTFAIKGPQILAFLFPMPN